MTAQTGAGQSVGIAVNLDPASFFKLDTGSANTVSTYGGNWSASTNVASLRALYGRFRPVSAGVKVTWVGNTTYDQGMLCSEQVSPNLTLAQFDAKDLANLSNGGQYFKTTPARDGIEITWRPNDPDDQGAFIPFDGAAKAVTAALNTPWLLCQAYGLTAAGNGVVMIEIVANFEGQYRNASFSPGGITTLSANQAAPGWYETAHQLYNSVAPIASGFLRLMAGAQQSSKPRAIMGVGAATVEELD